MALMATAPSRTRPDRPPAGDLVSARDWRVDESRPEASPAPDEFQAFGVIFPVKVWVTIFPSLTTKVSVPTS